MSKKLIISCEDEEALVMASIDRNVLDNIPTDQKYNGSMEDVLCQEYGYGFISPDDEKRYIDIPDYISEEDVLIWEAEKAIYAASITEAYPEAKEYILKKKS